MPPTEVFLVSIPSISRAQAPSITLLQIQVFVTHFRGKVKSFLEAQSHEKEILLTESFSLINLQLPAVGKFEIDSRYPPKKHSGGELSWKYWHP
jgi:hypothetical protein